MIVEFKPKKRTSVGSQKCKPYFNKNCYLRRKEYRKCRNLHWRIQRVETNRDRPFNLQRGGVMVICVVQNFFYGQHES